VYLTFKVAFYCRFLQYLILNIEEKKVMNWKANANICLKICWKVTHYTGGINQISGQS